MDLTSLISCYELDEASGNAVDIHGGLDLTDNNTVGAATGKINGARDFEAGSVEYFSRADSADHSLGDIDCTFTVWVNLESKASTLPALFCKYSNVFATSEFYLAHRVSTDRFEWGVYDGLGGASQAVANNFGAPSLGTWYFIVVEHDATGNEIRIQVNNGTADTTSHTTGILDGTNPFEVGRLTVANLYFDGMLDQLTFWKRLLTADEKSTIYNSGNGLAYPWTAAAPVDTTKREIFRGGPPIPGSPWFDLFLRPKLFAFESPPPRTEAARDRLGFTGGPPIPGAPWHRLFFPDIRHKNAPAAPAPQVDLGRGLPFIERVLAEDIRNDAKRRLMRHTEKVSAMVNSLLAKGHIAQDEPAKFAIRGGAFLSDRAPTTADDADTGAFPGMFWINEVTGTGYLCVSATIGAANWKTIT